MSEDFKKFMREFYSPLQHLRIMRFIDHMKAFFNCWKTNDKDHS